MESLELRKKGVLPIIDLAGHSYTIDVRFGELRNVEQPWLSLKLDQLVTTEDYRHYKFFYNMAEKQVFQATHNLVEMPKNVVLLEIPDELGLDPVGVARKYGLSDDYFLKIYPFQSRHKARITALEDSGIKEFIQKNSERRQAQKTVSKTL
ncbi:hypothetical protein [Algoriphagus pacificus]|uniref:Uncharacterized protein n=1 Tax=Algoriphagus pacificus TaxID=2811234 RepID=A0ABS3CK42_9BACT|nr:hypothetical protein [Algoriphagus pacificus]MBN7817478.1 hypothetical protein [Algoriphagus pacificus]